MAKSKLTPSTTSSSSRTSTISLPPSTSNETLFTSSSPGPMTLLSSFFSPDAASNPRSFSQLLACAMASPSPAATLGKVDVEEEFKYKQNWPVNLMVSGSEVDSRMFMIPPGLSPSGFLNSPGTVSPALSPFGMSHQQALAKVTAQAAYANSNMLNEAGKSTTSLNNPTESYKAPTTPEPKVSSIEPSKVSQSLTGVKSQSLKVAADKPADDGYNWRKYGQKQVKGSQYPRSYYKCTHSHCLVTKKVERSPEGQIIEIIYKGQHNHEHTPKKSVKCGNALNEIAKSQPNPEVNQLSPTEAAKRPLEAASDQIQGNVQDLLKTSPDSRQIKTEKLASHALKGPPETDNGPNQKRRSLGSTTNEPAHSPNTVMEARIIAQTRSEVDLLDDGFRWRKYGQKVVKGNYHPRSYYKCTSAGCNVRKHVERAPTDPKAVITTYEGKHNHDIPIGRGSSLNISSALPSPKLQMVVADI